LLQAELYRSLQSAFASLDIPWYLFGAQATILYGAARLTADVDITIALRGHPLAALITVLKQAGFETRISAAEKFAEQHRCRNWIWR
jgi:hypothetical protein